MEQTMVPEVQAADSVSNPSAVAMALTGDTKTDLSNIAKELGIQLDASGNAVEAPAQPVQRIEAVQAVEQPAAPVEVPPKFLNTDGSPNVERIAKAEVNLDDMIARYKAKEKEASQLHNRVNNPASQPTAVNPVPQPVAAPHLQPLEIQVANDLLSETQALMNQGYQAQQAQAIATARVQVRLQEARYHAEVSATADLRQRVEDQQRTTELKDMIDKDPSLLSPEMVDTLWTVRQSNPWINQAPEPWKAALHYYRGTNGHTQQVKTPTPTGTTAKAPPTPVGPVARVLPTIDINDRKSLGEMPIKDLEALVAKQLPSMRFGPRY